MSVAEYQMERARIEREACARTGITPETEGFWPCSMDMSRRELVGRIGQMNFRLTALRRQVEDYKARDISKRLDALMERCREEHYTPTYADLLAVKGESHG